MDILPLETILENHQLSPNEWQTISTNTRFRAMLEEATRVWNSSPNTAERLKIKFQTNLEMALPEMHARLHDPKEPLAAKVQLFIALQKGAGVGATDAPQGGERFQLVINVGDGRPTEITTLIPKTIDGETVYEGAEN